MKWGAHGAMGELKSPLGMLAGRCLVPCGLAAGAQGHSGLGVHCPRACCKKLATALFPVSLGSLGLGGALLLAAFDHSLLGFVASCSFVSVLVRSRSRLLSGLFPACSPWLAWVLA